MGCLVVLGKSVQKLLDFLQGLQCRQCRLEQVLRDYHFLYNLQMWWTLVRVRDSLSLKKKL